MYFLEVPIFKRYELKYYLSFSSPDDVTFGIFKKMLCINLPLFLYVKNTIKVKSWLEKCYPNSVPSRATVKRQFAKFNHDRRIQSRMMIISDFASKWDSWWISWIHRNQNDCHELSLSSQWKPSKRLDTRIVYGTFYGTLFFEQHKFRLAFEGWNHYI